VARLQVLGRYAILDTLPEEAFDRLTRLAARLFGTPTALVTFVDEERQWFKSCFGLDFNETPRSESFCAHAIQQAEVMIVPDATRDVRFRNNPRVTYHPGIRFYAGSPLITPDGFRIGSLCVISPEPRETFSAEDAARLEDLAALTMDELEWRPDRLRLSTELRANAQMVTELKRLTGRAELFEAVTALAACPLDLSDHIQALGALLGRELAIAALRVEDEPGAAWVRDGEPGTASETDTPHVRLPVGYQSGIPQHLTVTRCSPGAFTSQEQALLQAAAQSVQVVLARRQGRELTGRLPSPGSQEALKATTRSVTAAGGQATLLEFTVEGFLRHGEAPGIQDPEAPMGLLGEALRLNLGRAAGPYWPGGLRAAFVLPGDASPDDLDRVLTRAAAVVRASGFEPQGLRVGRGSMPVDTEVTTTPLAPTARPVDPGQPQNSQAFGRPTAPVAMGNLVFDPKRRQVSNGGVSVQLTRPEAGLLGLLMAQPETIVSRGALMAALDRPGRNPEALVNVHMSYLRQKLGHLTSSVAVHTVPRRGYLLRLEHPGATVANNRSGRSYPEAHDD